MYDAGYDLAIYIIDLKVINGTGIYSIDPDMMQYALKELYNYQSSHFLPTEVLDMRNNGPAVTWKQAVKKFVNINAII